MAVITDISQLDPGKDYTYADYLTWKFDEAVELIKGKILKMSPAPRTRHQRILRNLNILFNSVMNFEQCEYFIAPFDVRLYDKTKSQKARKEIHTVVQPDLCIICDQNKIDEYGCIGAPDLIVEILSPGNSTKEMRTKFNLYEESGVREYWVADPEHQTIHLFYADEQDKYQLSKIYVYEDILQSVIFPELTVDLKDVFPEETF
jgi:Uma2 family endonuclease